MAGFSDLDLNQIVAPANEEERVRRQAELKEYFDKNFNNIGPDQIYETPVGGKLLAELEALGMGIKPDENGKLILSNRESSKEDKEQEENKMMTPPNRKKPRATFNENTFTPPTPEEVQASIESLSNIEDLTEEEVGNRDLFQKGVQNSKADPDLDKKFKKLSDFAKKKDFLKSENLDEELAKIIGETDDVHLINLSALLKAIAKSSGNDSEKNDLISKALENFGEAVSSKNEPEIASSEAFLKTLGIVDKDSEQTPLQKEVMESARDEINAFYQQKGLVASEVDKSNDEKSIIIRADGEDGVTAAEVAMQGLKAGAVMAALFAGGPFGPFIAVGVLFVIRCLDKKESEEEKELKREEREELELLRMREADKDNRSGLESNRASRRAAKQSEAESNDENSSNLETPEGGKTKELAAQVVAEMGAQLDEQLDLLSDEKNNLEQGNSENLATNATAPVEAENTPSAPDSSDLEPKHEEDGEKNKRNAQVAAMEAMKEAEMGSVDDEGYLEIEPTQLENDSNKKTTREK